MRNLKRALSLTLASVMLLGMMVIGTSAASYPDVDKDNNVEAIEVLQAVGVMQGDDKGNFDPDRTVSRNEMAIVMAKLLNLDYNYYSESCPFWDVPDYAKPYVGACFANGIVSGYSATQYGGSDTVTAVQAASMMMRALGYFQYDSDYADGFVISTVRQASKIGLFKDINAGQDTPLTRDQVAQLTLNTLKTGMVEAKKTNADISFGSGDTAVTINGAVSYEYVTSNDPKFNSAIDNITATTIGAINNAPIVELGEKLYDGDLKLVKNATDDFGRPSQTWTYKNDKVGTYAKKGDLIATYDKKVSKGDIYNLLSSAVRSDLTNTPTKFTVTVDGQTVTADNCGGVGTGMDSPAAPANYYVRNSSQEIYTPVAGSSRRGTLTEVYLDKDNNVDIVIVDTFVYQATSDYSSSRDDVRMAPAGDTALALKGGELTLKGEDFNIQDVKTDDYLLITAASPTGTAYEVQSVEVAEKVTGEVTGYTANDSVTIDGTTYNYSATTLKSGSGVRTTQYTVGQDAVVVLDNYGNIIAVDEAVSSNSFVFIKDFGSTSGLTTKVLADAYFTDGTNEEITIDRVDSEKSASVLLAGAVSGKKAINTWYTYSVNSDGKYVLYTPSNRTNKHGTYANSSTTDTKPIVYTGKVDFMATTDANADPDVAGIANDKTIMLVKDSEGDMNVYIGTANIPDINLGKKTGAENTTATVYYLNGSKGYAEYAFVDLEGSGSSVVGGGDETSFLYVLRFKDNLYGANATQYFTYSTLDPESGEEVTRTFESKLFGNNLDGSSKHPYSLQYKPSTNKDDRITSLPDVPEEPTGKYFNKDITNGSVVYDNGSLTIGGGGDKYVVASDSKITLVIKKDPSTVTLLSDPNMDHEVYFQTQGVTVDSTLKDLLMSGNIAGATKSSTSSVIDTLYITVTHVGPSTPATPDEIGDELADVPANGTLEKENVNLGTGSVAITDGKTLAITGDVTGGNSSITGTSGNGKVTLNNAAVGGTGTLTVTADAVVSGAVSVASGKTLDLATATLSGTLSGEGTVTVDNATVAASTTLNADSGNVNMDAATVAGTLNVNDDVTISTATVTGTINVAADATLTVSTSVSGAGKIVAAAEGAKIAVGSSANATDLLTMVNDGVKFYDNNGDEITEAANLANKTFVWREAGWDQASARATGKPAGWVQEGFDPNAESVAKAKELKIAVVDTAQGINDLMGSWSITGESATFAYWTGSADEATSDAWLKLSPYVFVYYERTEGTAPEDGAIAVKVDGAASALTGNDLMSGGLTFGDFREGKDVQVFSFRMFNGTGDNPPAGLVNKTENTEGANGTYTFSVTWTYGGVNKEATASAYTYTHVAEGANE